MSLQKPYPPLYSPWLAELFPEDVLETKATCHNCAMARPVGVTRDPGPFDPTLKCCTYFPFIPNFGLGAMLKEGSAESRLRLQVAASSGLLLPQGLFASPEREHLAKESGPLAFGRERHLLCPFFDTSSLGCSIWQFRPGTCTSYFCKSDRDEEGLEYWANIESFLNHFEWSLANEVLWRMGFTNDDISLNEPVLLTEEPGEERDFLIDRAWLEWSDRREEFYIKCHERALTITRDELTALLDL